MFTRVVAQNTIAVQNMLNVPLESNSTDSTHADKILSCLCIIPSTTAAAMAPLELKSGDGNACRPAWTISCEDRMTV